MIAPVIKVKIEGIAAGGAGFARAGGKSLFVDGTVPGETVVCRITEEHAAWSQAELLEIDEASADRVQPVCSLYGICGGCNLQHIGYPAQLAAKTAIVQNMFARIGGAEPEAVPSEPWEYRNRMQFHCIRENGSPTWGLKARKSDGIVPVGDCPIADPAIRELLRGDTKTRQALMPPGKDRFTVYARSGMVLSEGGAERGKTQILDRRLSLDAGAFFQSNGAMLEKLVADLQKIAAGLSQDIRSLPMADLYCGVGVFAAFLAETFAGDADLVEEDKTALALARENLAHVKSVYFNSQKSENWSKNGFKRRYGLIIADPPRQGLDKTLAFRLASEGPPVLAYVSCDPATLARDSKTLIAGGYKLEKVKFYDFYPQTSHIESLALFKKPNL